jgi:signal peptidase
VVLLLVAVGPRVLPYQTFYVRSGSMVPAMPVGSLIVATHAPASSLGPGDVIAFSHPRHQGEVVTHRITRIEDGPDGPVFVTKGDANAVEDPWRVPAVGSGWQQRSTIPLLGYLIGALQAAAAGGTLVIVAALAALVCLLWNVWRTPRAAPTPA